MEALIAILIFVGGAIWNVIQKRKQEQEDAKPWVPPMPRRDGTQPPPAQSPPPQPASSWEEQLRRLLEGEREETRPPVVVERRPAPPPLPATAPTSSRRPQTRRPEPDFDESMDIGLPVRMPSLTQSAEAWQRGNQLEASVAERFRRVDQRIISHQPAEIRNEVSAELQHAIQLVRHRSTQRAAIVASVVLGPPKALET